MGVNLSCPHGDRYPGSVIFYVNHMSGGAGFVEWGLWSEVCLPSQFARPLGGTGWYYVACVSDRTPIIIPNLSIGKIVVVPRASCCTYKWLYVMPRFIGTRKTCLISTQPL